ncbi:MAG TPA: peptide chain release factor N(5)-glutamine methyltransferase [Phycisphaerae bacterium]|nr:peptide chain release factor N(5)-glutamine methyltransferase [Phycisphaerae bacterium]HRY71065.1 peptide chain release factor N(5)-glutamine methyltransferase [Phycisphaerae bacterium]HSA29155.1 peptide chain release factor N(5)-glutamine methyltransferase [Phycisphaerae bacterium]
MADVNPQAGGCSTTQQEVWTVGRLLQWTTGWFQQKQVEGGRLAAELLLARAMNCRKIELYTRYDQEPTGEQRAAFRELVRSAGAHTPIAYLLGFREFFSLEFEVTPAVLVPRPETEALVQRAIDLCREMPDQPWRILDVGTGTGCVAVAIAKYAKNASVVAGDISGEAAAVARRNVERHGLDERVRVVEADCTALPAGITPAGGFDLVVSNPPYISEELYRTLPPHIRDHEPKIALALDGSDGLVMYRRLAAEAPAVLRQQGRLLAEIGSGQLTSVVETFEAAGGWSYMGAHRDPTDPHERVVEFLRD